MPWTNLRDDIEEELGRLGVWIEDGHRWSVVGPDSLAAKHAARVKEYRASPRGRPRVSETNHRYYASAKGRLAQETKNVKRRAARAAEREKRSCRSSG